MNPVIDGCGNKFWMNEAGQLHRLDGPAVEYTDGVKEWWCNGIRHREDGPAIDSGDYYKEWVVGGRRHRIDGPAIIWGDGDKEWWFNGNRYSEDEFNKKLLTSELVPV